MSCTRTAFRIAGLLVLCSLLVLPAMAQTFPAIRRGTDLFTTPAGSGTVVDFSGNPIPAGFFCAGSAPFAGSVPLKGVPLPTSPAGIAGTTDTIVERLTDGVFTTAGTATFGIVLRALRLTGENTITVACPAGPTTWRVDVCACGLQPTNSITVTIDPACGTCGKANGKLQLQACVTFTRTDTGQVAGPLKQSIVLDFNNMDWCYKAGGRETTVLQPFGVDTNCDGEPDLTLPATSNFHPGWKCTNEGLDCWTQFAALTHCHPNYTNPGAHDHCINPVCGKRTN